MLDPIPLYDANGNENSSNQRQNRYYAENVNEFNNVGDVQQQIERQKTNQNIKHQPKNVKKSSSQKIDNEILLSHHKSDEDVARNVTKRTDNERNDNNAHNQMDETYTRLLLEFKQSLNNFIELNQVSLNLF